MQILDILIIMKVTPSTTHLVLLSLDPETVRLPLGPSKLHSIYVKGDKVGFLK